MRKVNALKVRQNLGAVLDDLDRGGPILIEKNRTPRAVLISLDDYQRRFAGNERERWADRLMAEVDAIRARHPWDGKSNAVDDIRAIREERDREMAERLGW